MFDIFDIIGIFSIITGLCVVIGYAWWDGYLKGMSVGKRQILIEDLKRLERN